MIGRAVLLVNLGSPQSTGVGDVRRYLDEFLMDPYVLDVPAPLRALIVKGLILPTRPAKSAHAYAQIWTEEGSPLIVISARMRAALEAEMEVPVGLAMRYGEPAIASALDELLARAGPVDDLVIVPLYPQYAMASTKTVEVAVQGALRARGLQARFVAPFFDDPGYLDAVAAIAREHTPADTQYMLFSYHGIPKRHLRKTDPTHGHCLRSEDCCSTPSEAHATCYRHQVIATTAGLADRLGLPAGGYGLSFQSRLGTGWLQPFTDIELAQLPARGITRLAVACPSFVADCLETLEEIVIRGRATFLEAGGESFTYLPCPNDDARWIRALARLCAQPVPVET
jgi:ferrochelatase